MNQHNVPIRTGAAKASGGHRHLAARICVLIAIVALVGVAAGMVRLNPGAIGVAAGVVLIACMAVCLGSLFIGRRADRDTATFVGAGAAPDGPDGRSSVKG